MAIQAAVGLRRFENVAVDAKNLFAARNPSYTVIAYSSICYLVTAQMMYRLQYLGYVKCHENLAILTSSAVEAVWCRLKASSSKLGARHLLTTFVDYVKMTLLIGYSHPTA